MMQKNIQIMPNPFRKKTVFIVRVQKHQSSIYYYHEKEKKEQQSNHCITHNWNKEQ